MSRFPTGAKTWAQIVDSLTQEAPVAETWRIGQRNPTAVNALEAGTDPTLVIDRAAMERNPEMFRNNMMAVRSEGRVPPGMRNPSSIADQHVGLMTDNLLALHDLAQRSGISGVWYPGASRISGELADLHGISKPQAGGVIAALSPKNPWDLNVEQAKRLVDSRDTALSGSGMLDADGLQHIALFADRGLISQEEALRLMTRDFPALAPREQAIWIKAHDLATRSRTFPRLSPEGEPIGPMLTDSGRPMNASFGLLGPVEDALAILNDGSPQSISRALGAAHKVRNFYNNIVAPFSRARDVTIDTHAVAGGYLTPFSDQAREVGHNFGAGTSNSSVFGTSGTYGLNADAYREAARQLGIQPRMLQSMTWEQIRRLFPAKTKAGKVDDARLIWRDARRGALTQDQARARILDLAGAPP